MIYFPDNNQSRHRFWFPIRSFIPQLSGRHECQERGRAVKDIDDWKIHRCYVVQYFARTKPQGCCVGFSAVNKSICFSNDWTYVYLLENLTRGCEWRRIVVMRYRKWFLLGHWQVLQSESVTCKLNLYIRVCTTPEQPWTNIQSRLGNPRSLWCNFATNHFENILRIS